MVRLSCVIWGDLHTTHTQELGLVCLVELGSNNDVHTTHAQELGLVCLVEPPSDRDDPYPLYAHVS